MVRHANSLTADHDLTEKSLLEAENTILKLCSILGLDAAANSTDEIDSEILDMLEQRSEAKAKRDFAEADRIRDELAKRGYRIEDTAQGPKLIKEEH